MNKFCRGTESGRYFQEPIESRRLGCGPRMIWLHSLKPEWTLMSPCWKLRPKVLTTSQLKTLHSEMIRKSRSDEWFSRTQNVLGKLPQSLLAILSNDRGGQILATQEFRRLGRLRKTKLESGQL